MANILINKSKWYWLMQLMGWGSFTLSFIVYYFLQNGLVSNSDIVFCLAMFLGGVSFSHFIRFVFRLYKWTNKNITEILHKLGILSVLVGSLLVLFLYLVSLLSDQILLQKITVANFMASALTFAVIFFIWGAIYFSVYFFRNFKKEEIKNLKQKAQLNEIQLNKLKSQLNPHFVFNAMNGLRGLIDEDTEKAKQGITQLSNILRHTLNVNKNKLIFLSEEIKLVEDYLNLEKIRFEERLEFSISILEEAKNYEVPPMLIQTLVENAIKHGISNLVRGGKVDLKGVIVEKDLHLTIINSGTYNPINIESGFGIENSKQRLDLIFNGQAKFNIRNLNKEQVITELVIPKNISI